MEGHRDCAHQPTCAISYPHTRGHTTANALLIVGLRLLKISPHRRQKPTSFPALLEFPSKDHPYGKPSDSTPISILMIELQNFQTHQSIPFSSECRSFSGTNKSLWCIFIGTNELNDSLFAQQECAIPNIRLIFKAHAPIDEVLAFIPRHRFV